MELKLLPLLRGTTPPVEQGTDFNFSGCDFPGYEVPGPVHAHVSAVAAQGAVELRLSLRGTLTGQCARCCEPFVRDFCIEKDYRITRQDMADEFPELPLTAEGIDLEELSYSELLLETDTVQLCSESCEGLCQHCGKPVAQCTCEEDAEGDPRWHALRALLNEDET